MGKKFQFSHASILLAIASGIWFGLAWLFPDFDFFAYTALAIPGLNLIGIIFGTIGLIFEKRKLASIIGIILNLIFPLLLAVNL